MSGSPAGRAGRDAWGGPAPVVARPPSQLRPRRGGGRLAAITVPRCPVPVAGVPVCAPARQCVTSGVGVARVGVLVCRFPGLSPRSVAP